MSCSSVTCGKRGSRAAEVGPLPPAQSQPATAETAAMASVLRCLRMDASLSFLLKDVALFLKHLGLAQGFDFSGGEAEFLENFIGVLAAFGGR